MKRIKAIALGDSITKGVVLSKENKYSVVDNSYLDIISTELELTVANFGKFGAVVSCAAVMTDRLSDQISEVDYVFLGYGGNDCDFDWMKIAGNPEDEHLPKTPLASFKEQMASVINKIKEKGAKPVITSLPPIISDSYFSFITRLMSEEQKANVLKWLDGDVQLISRWHESYNLALFNIAKELQVPIIDITSPFDSYRGDLKALYSSDGIHPNAAGHKMIAETVINSYF